MSLAFFNFASALQRDARLLNRSLILICLATLVAPSNGIAQSHSIQMTFGDQSANQPQPVYLKLANYQESVANPPRRVVLASGTLVTNQQSNFEPAPQATPERDLQTLNLPGTLPPRPKTRLPNLQEPEALPNPLDARQSDDPIAPPILKLTEPDSGKSDSMTNPEFDRSTQAPVGNSMSSDAGNPSNRGDYALPSIASVREPISMMPMTGIPQSDPSSLLSQDQNVNFDQRYVGRETTYAEVSGTHAQAKSKTWKPHNFYHRPLYFEEPNVERQGNRRAFQNVASTIHFFSTIPKLPSMIGEAHPHERIYTHGNGRPGDCTDYRIVRPSHSRKGAALQTLVTLGIILP